MAAYYNEIDPQAAQYLRNLIAAGLIAPGDVDTRSIADVHPDDLRGYIQCHFFAGIGVWSYALRRAGWRDTDPVWTGSCPCQPFSQAGIQAAFEDPRHLWPHFARLIRERRPPVVFGEQVASKAVDAWVDLVHADMEGMDYAFGCVPFPSASVGAPHIRDRIFWVGDTDNPGLEGHARDGGATRRSRPSGSAAPTGVPLWLANGHGEYQRPTGNAARAGEPGRGREAQRLGHSDSQRTRRDTGAVLGAQGGIERQVRSQPDRCESAGPTGWLADDDLVGRIAAPVAELRDEEHHAEPCSDLGGAGPVNGLWADADWLFCRDGKWRPVESGTFPLVDGAPARVVRLRAYGNAINAEQARIFVEAYLEARARPARVMRDDLV